MTTRERAPRGPNRALTVRDVTLNAAEWTRIVGYTRGVLARHIARNGVAAVLDLIESRLPRVDSDDRATEIREVRGVRATAQEWAHLLGLEPHTLSEYAVKHGWEETVLSRIRLPYERLAPREPKAPRNPKRPDEPKLPAPRRGKSKLTSDEIAALRAEGLTLSAIGERAGLTKERVRQILALSRSESTEGAP